MNRTDTPSDPVDLAATMVAVFEGFRSRAYLCPAGVWTIGYGRTGPDVTPGLVTDEPTERAQLRARLRLNRSRMLAMGAAMDGQPGQVAAILSFADNVGFSAAIHSALVRRHRAGDFEGARRQFARWRFAGGVALAGLVKRRAIEAVMYADGPRFGLAQLRTY